jgi:uncharacterized protein (DUF1697 family)
MIRYCTAMGVVICLLRGVNVGGHNKIKMEALRALCESLKLRDACTYVQSGNVVFRTNEKDMRKLALRLEDALEKSLGFRPPVILRTTSELREVVAKNPFARRTDIEPGKLLVNFLPGDPGDEGRERVRQMKIAPEELRIEGRELYIHFPNGQGKSKLPQAAIDKALKMSGTGRNWNSVTKLLEMAESLDQLGG